MPPCIQKLIYLFIGLAGFSSPTIAKLDISVCVLCDAAGNSGVGSEAGERREGGCGVTGVIGGGREGVGRNSCLWDLEIVCETR